MPVGRAAHDGSVGLLASGRPGGLAPGGLKPRVGYFASGSGWWTPNTLFSVSWK